MASRLCDLVLQIASRYVASIVITYGVNRSRTRWRTVLVLGWWEKEEEGTEGWTLEVRASSLSRGWHFGVSGLGLAINNLSPNEETKRRSTERGVRHVVAGEEDTVRNANARDVRSPTSSPSPRNTYGVYVFYHVYVYVVGMYTNVSDAFDRAGHGHKQLCIGLAPSRCDVIKREDSRWTSSAVQIPREREREREVRLVGASGPGISKWSDVRAIFQRATGVVCVRGCGTCVYRKSRPPTTAFRDLRRSIESAGKFFLISYVIIGKITSGHICTPTKRKTPRAVNSNSP